MTEDQQMDLFGFDLTFIKMLRQQVFDGEVADIGPNALSVLVVLRALAPVSGISTHPTLETIMDYTGIGKKAVREAIKKLTARKYIEVLKIGRKNVYKLLEKVKLESLEPDKREDQIATLPYGATETRKHFSALATYAKTGELDKGSPIIINNLDLTINYNASGGSAVFINARELDQIPKGLYRTAVERILGMVPGQIEETNRRLLDDERRKKKDDE